MQTNQAIEQKGYNNHMIGINLPQNESSEEIKSSESCPVEKCTKEIGREIFYKLRSPDRATAVKNLFSAKSWSNKIMELSMLDPELKINLFRLVDVLPTLRSDKAIIQHLIEYLYPVLRKNYPLLAPLLNVVSPDSILTWIPAGLTKFSVTQMANQFIAGSDPEAALPRLKAIRESGCAFTVDLLGEYSVSEDEAVAYLDRYLEALTVLGKYVPHWSCAKELVDSHAGETTPICISVKLTAMYSQCSPLNVDTSVAILSKRLTEIAKKAASINAQVYVDAEDSGNNEIIYKTFVNVFSQPDLLDLPYPGIVVQAYSKGAEDIIDNLINFAQLRGRPIAIRLVKGAYWDHETTICLQNNWESPLFKVKESSDANFERLSRKLIDNHNLILPAFGSHNIRSLAHACAYAKHKKVPVSRFELQMLYGMADPIAAAFSSAGYLVRQYTPLGEMIPGMGYLIRRLLENTSNESFLRHTFFEETDAYNLLRKPEYRDF